MWIFAGPSRIAFGEDALDELQWLQEQGSKVLIVTDKIVSDLHLDKITNPLKDMGYNWKVFNSVEPDPSLETCKKAAELADEFKPDWFMALGGGSVMDACKAAFFIYERPDVDLSGVVPFEFYNLRQKVRGLITIPTTSGTGAELTPAMVITDTIDHRKINPTTREVIADMVIVDPVFVMEMPKFLTATTGLDAVSHAIEAYLSEWRNDFSDGLAIHSLKLLFEFLPRAYRHGKDDREAREKVHNAATISGLAFGSSNVGQAHSIGHSLGAMFRLPHGLCVGIYLPRVIEYIANDDPSITAKLARELGITASDDEEASTDLVSMIEKLMADISISTKLKDYDITEEDFNSKLDRLAELASLDTGTISSTRVPTDGEFKILLLAGYHGTNVDC